MTYTYLENYSGKVTMDESSIPAKLQRYLELEKQKKAVDADLQQALGNLRDAAGKSTFKVGDQWYQVRVRNGLRYMCLLDGPPRGRPRKSELEAKEKAKGETPEDS